MKKLFWIFGIIFLSVNFSCITDNNKYKETNIFEEYEAQNGFTILHLPPVLFKIVLFANESTSHIDSLQLMDKIDNIKLMFFEQNNNSIPVSEIKQSMNKKIKENKYNLLTSIVEADNDIAIYTINKEDIIHEILITAISESGYYCINIIGELSKEEVKEVYKTINMEKLKTYQN